MSGGAFTSAVILAAGMGTRMKSETTKQRMKISGKSILLRSVEAFDRASEIDEIIVVCGEGEVEFAKNETRGIQKLRAVVVGGKTRRESAERGFKSVSSECKFVAIHDAARCMIRSEQIDEVVKAAYIHGAASAVSLVTDTVKVLDGDGMICNTVSRDSLRFAATPQVFSSELYRTALEFKGENNVTDDNMLVELLGHTVFPVDTGEYNFKITTRRDLEYAEFLIERGYVDE